MSNSEFPGKKHSTDSPKNAQLSRRQFIHSSAAGVLGAALSHHAGADSKQEFASDHETFESSKLSCRDNQITEEEILARYQRASDLEHRASAGELLSHTALYPHWIGDSENFWYRRTVKGDTQFRLVNAGRGNNTEAFDHTALARALAQASGEAVAANHLPLSELDLNLTSAQLSFRAFGKHWRYDTTRQTCQEIDAYPDTWRISPDGTKAAFVREHNLWLRHLASGEEYALTQDGGPFRTYASTPTAFGRQEHITLEARWSADSRQLLTQVKDTRQLKSGPPLVQYVPLDDNLRPRILHPERRVGLPGDTHIEGYQLLAIDVETGQIQNANYPPCAPFYPPYAGFFSSHRGWWGDNRRAYFVDLLRGGLTARLIEFDTHSGATRVLIEEKADSEITLIPGSHLATLVIPIPESNEIIWYSDRSGWAHLYLYDLNSGKLKKTITQGEWMVRNVLHCDVQRRELIIQTAGREVSRNPYYCDICRVGIDSGELTTLIDTDHEYRVCDQRSRFSFGDLAAQGVSPNGRYLVATRTRIDQPPESLLLDRYGETVMTLEQGKIENVPEGWQWPETAMLKAADGKTELCAVIYRPSDFSPQRSYPVLDRSLNFSGVCLTPITTMDSFSGSYFAPAIYAELGFIVVCVATRGTALRDKTFTLNRDPMVPFLPNQSDCVTAIKQLAERYPYIDLSRVGIAPAGSSTAISGLFAYPNFYRAGVSCNPAVDLRLMAEFWGQLTWSGPPPKQAQRQLEDLAGNLCGKLLLMHGMLDNVIPVATTFRLVEALQRANKHFDMLLLPNDGHYMFSYAMRRAWDYLVEHLMGAKPPEDFLLQSATDERIKRDPNFWPQD